MPFSKIPHHLKHKIEKVSNKVPAIHIVGLTKDYLPQDLQTMIVKQNFGIRALFESPATSEEDKLIDVIAVKPLKNNNQVFKAIVRVSNVIWSVLAKQRDRIFIGSQSTCKVYDSIFVLRCFKCQAYGHHSRDCTHESVCGFCAGSHATNTCVTKDCENGLKCIHCVKAGKSDVNHHTGDPKCSVYQEQQSRIKKTIPFYQRKWLDPASLLDLISYCSILGPWIIK